MRGVGTKLLESTKSWQISRSTNLERVTNSSLPPRSDTLAGVYPPAPPPLVAGELYARRVLRRRDDARCRCHTGFVRDFVSILVFVVVDFLFFSFGEFTVYEVCFYDVFGYFHHELGVRFMFGMHFPCYFY